jgi:hypothetical protein
MQLQRDATQLAQDNARCLCCGLLVIIGLIIAMIVLMILAIYAAVVHHTKPCDQPLKYYVLVLVVWSQVPQLVTRVLNAETWTMTKRAILTIALGSVSWFIIGWGFYMISMARTCHKTNPDLFFPTRRLIYAQIGMVSLVVVIGIMLVIFARRFYLYISRLMEGPGCQEAVQNLPKVDVGDKSLIAEDGEIKACCICLEALSDKSKAIVRTPCNHLYHQDCLSDWAKNHLTCPCCRQVMGNADKMEEP